MKFESTGVGILSPPVSSGLTSLQSALFVPLKPKTIGERIFPSEQRALIWPRLGRLERSSVLFVIYHVTIWPLQNIELETPSAYLS